MANYILESFPKEKYCNFCLTKIVDSLTLGQIYKFGNLTVHYFCLLFASKGVQRGTDRQGLLGFFMKDIRAELNRSSLIKCHYCHRKGAAVLCAKSKCKVKFHLPCGLKKNSLHFFCDDFKSFCVRHRSRSDTYKSLHLTINSNEIICIFCFDSINVKNHFSYVWPICCKPSSLVHKQCMQKMALSAGYYFKCPFCANSKKFNKSMSELGIYIPKQEASWETEADANDMRLELKCLATPCFCPKGSSFNRPGSKWYLQTCAFCGSSAVHLACSEKWKTRKKYSFVWQCPDCSTLDIENELPELMDCSSSPQTRFHTACSLTNGSTNSYSTSDERNSQKEDSEDYTITVGLETLEQKGSRFVTYTQYINNFDKSPIVLLTNEAQLNSLKDITNVTEIIVNNKRCVIALNRVKHNNN